MIERLAIIAPGLLGGSVARAARERAAAKQIALWARRPEARAALAQQSWCDEASPSLAEAVHGAALVVIAAPVDLIVPLAAEIAPHLAPGAIVTDVGSVKGAIAGPGAAALARATVRPAPQFVGSHPMAGSEKTGWEHGSSTLFQQRTCFVTPLAGTDRSAAAAVAQFWTALGADVFTVAPEIHDQIVAHISHLPQLIASALCAFLAGHHPEWRQFAGGGLRDTTRIAGSDPQLWKSIFAGNQAPVLAALRGLQAELGRCEQALAVGNWDAVAEMMSRGKSYRDGFKP
jgi:prephenate dehydrogenase